jgi:hypothetical protein
MDIKVENNTLVITCPLGAGVPSSSGKTLVVATTNGFQSVENSDIKVSLNAVKPRKHS